MTRHFHEQLIELKNKVLRMGTLAQYCIESAIYSYIKRNPEFAEQVFEKEKLINQMEIEIDDTGHGLLALDQPMAVDMRVITTMLKINTDLERIADHAINIAERVLLLIDDPLLSSNFDASLLELARHVQDILRQVLESLQKEDAAMAQEVLRRDDEIDNQNDKLYSDLEAYMKENPAFISSGMRLARISHDLERIGDLANNIAENVLYMKQGKEVRHRTSED